MKKKDLQKRVAELELINSRNLDSIRGYQKMYSDMLLGDVDRMIPGTIAKNNLCVKLIEGWYE